MSIYVLASVKEAQMENRFIFILPALIGLSFMLKILFMILKWVWGAFLRPRKNLKEYGSWAIVTGPTEGIGKAIAFNLAKDGLNLVLVGRNPAKLKSVSSELHKKYAEIEVRTIVCDFAEESDDGIRRIEEGIEDLDVGILINNAGVGGPHMMYLHEADHKLIDHIIRVNVIGLTKVTHVVLPGMLKRRRGAIVNLGSGSASLLPSYPLDSTYAASKAYVDKFSRSLHVEYKQCGIHVQCQAPLFVATNMTEKLEKKPSLFVPSAEEYADWCMSWIGGEEVLCTPYWSHYIQWVAVRFVPGRLLDWWMLRQFTAVREKQLSEESREHE